jgi:hypothetical protein
MAATNGIVGDSLVHNDDFGRIAARLEPHRNALRLFLRIESPCVDEPKSGLDRFELARDPDYPTVGKAVRNSILPADLEINACIDAFDARRTPPGNQLLGARPRFE